MRNWLQNEHLFVCECEYIVRYPYNFFYSFFLFKYGLHRTENRIENVGRMLCENSGRLFRFQQFAELNIEIINTFGLRLLFTIPSYDTQQIQRLER